MPRSPKGRAAARGLDAPLSLQQVFMPAGDGGGGHAATARYREEQQRRVGRASSPHDEAVRPHPNVDLGEPIYGDPTGQEPHFSRDRAPGGGSFAPGQHSSSEHRINVSYDMPNEFKKRQVTRRDARASAQLHAKERAIASSADLGPVT
jgi:hypothetical protein